MRRLEVFSRRFGWSTLLAVAAIPTYIFFTLPLLATIADFLGLLGAKLPLRTRFSVAGAMVCLGAALFIRWRCPRTIAHSQSHKRLNDLGGLPHLKNIWREELNRHENSVGLSDIIRTVRRVIRPPYASNTQYLADNATLSDVLKAIERAQFNDLGEVSEAARSNFEHIEKSWQLILGSVLILGWVLSITGMVIAACSIFF